jgi:capsular exopolysaccharide synthesis family protein
MAGFGGLVLGLGLAILLELLAPGISRHEDVSRAFDIDHLSSVPSPNDGKAILSASKAVRLVVAEPQSRYADAIRNARRELDMRRTSAAPRIILVTSSVAGEGAEVIASNLAHNYAMTGGRPLLIDGDLRLLPLTRQLAAERSRGLLDQIIDGQLIEAAILRDALTGLHFLPAMGPAPPQRSIPETLNSDAMAQALAGLKSHFDTIVISVPPLLPVIDGRILADYADQIVFVVAWQKTPKQVAKAALKTLGINDRKLAGVVLNDVAPESLDETRGWQRGFMSSLHAQDAAGAQYAS